MKRLFCILFVLSLSGCSIVETKDEENIQNITYEYEIVNAEIKELDIKHWFAGTHRYKWYIEVYYDLYDLHYEENSWSNGVFNAPSFYDYQIGDYISVGICNTYKNGEIIKRDIIGVVSSEL